MSASPPPPHSIAPRRRNGRPQACEPCRKRKAACDHSLPVCTRCKRRGTEAECTYHAAPMTRRGASGSTATATATVAPLYQETEREISRSTNGAQPAVGRESTRLPATPSATSPSSAAGSLGTQKAGTATRLFSEASGFLGPTSFSATFLDNSDGLGPLSGPTDEDMDTRKTSVPGNAAGNAKAVLTESQIQLGMQVLANIPDEATCRRLHELNQYTDNGILKLSDEYLSADIWKIVGEHGGNPERHWRKLVERITAKTATPLRDIDDAMEWLDSIVGENLRWEVLGLLFTYWAGGGSSADPNDPIFAKFPAVRNDPRQVMSHLKKYAAACSELCNAAKSTNVISMYLISKCSTLESMIGGDTSLAVWRGHADVAAIALYLGLHNDTEQKITLYTEIRRRIYAKVFNMDKTLAVIVGRPPLLSSRFSVTPLPLDVDNDVLLAGEPALSRELSRLDKNGWNTDGQLHIVTTSRARCTFAAVRGTILELALGRPTEDLPDQAMELKQQSHLLYEQLPSSVVWHLEDVFNLNVIRTTLFCRLLTRLGYLQNLFLIERLLTKDGHANKQDLIDVAKEMLDLTLLIFKHHDRFAGFHGDYEWLIIDYAAPVSGTLCAELLKHARGLSDVSLVFPRSGTIQSLSIFVAFLDWVKPSAPNADLCYRVKQIVSKVLDQVLTGSVETPSIELSGGMPGWDLGLQSSDFPSLEDFGNFDLIGSFNFLG